MLNDRGYSYRPIGLPRSSVNSSSGEHSSSITATPVFDNVTPNTSTPIKPSVKLPPQSETPEEKFSTFRASGSVASSKEPAVQLPVVHVEDLMSLPGVEWSMKWKETTGIDSVCGTFKGQDIGQANIATDDEKNKLLENSPQRVISSTFSPRPRRQMQYRVNIPPLSARQRNVMAHPGHSMAPTDLVGRSHESLGSLRYVSIACPAGPSAPFHHLTTTQRKSSPTVVSSAPAHGQASNTGDWAPSQDRTRHSDEHHKSIVERAWTDLIPVPESLSSQGVSSTLANFGSSSPLETIPLFPFPSTTDMDTFSFHPVLPHTPSNPVFGNTTSSFLYNIQNPTDNKHLTASDVNSSHSEEQPEQITAKLHTPCYEWNFYLDCSDTKSGQCQKMHICEICASSEHRAAQHWHHLATAPLPEIQIQPKLSTPTAPPESPTLSAIKDRVPLYAPSFSAESLSQSSLESPNVLPFVPLLGLEGSQKAAAQSDRLKRRKVHSRNKASPPGDTHTQKPGETASKTLSPRGTQRIPIMAPPTSPFDKPVEVILAPPIRPFQGRDWEPSTTPKALDNTSPSGKLRVTAPAFEPSHAGAWIPFSSPKNQFGNLFQIPSKENRKIEIVAPKKKGKEVVGAENLNTTTAVEIANMKEYAETKLSNPKFPKAKDKSETDRLPRTKPSLLPAFKESIVSDSPQQSLDTFSDLSWNIPGPSTPCPTSATTSMCLKTNSGMPPRSRQSSHLETSAKPAEHLYSISDTAFRSDNLDNNVLEILDEQLQAIISKESEETVAATLETIIEICSIPSAERSPRNSHFEVTPNPVGEPASTAWPWHERQNNHLEAHFFRLNDFADDAFCPKSHAERPRSSDSSSTAPLSSPDCPVNTVDVDKMMSCAASKGTGPCNCGLGSWFHHSPV